MIRRLSAYKIGQTVRDDGPQSHLSKAGTPTMGGALILVAIAVSTLLWGDLSNRYVWVVLLTTLAFGLIGLVDDYKKLVKRDPRGLAGAVEILLAVGGRPRRGLGAVLDGGAAGRDPADPAFLQGRGDRPGPLVRAAHLFRHRRLARTRSTSPTASTAWRSCPR